MVKFKTGNILEDPSEVLVNTVNCAGIMGKGLALEFKLRYLPMFTKYQEACSKKELLPGMVWVWSTGEEQPKYIFNFSTKDHWRSPSKLSWIKQGLDELLKQTKAFKVKSVAIPPLGCGLGGLDWNVVKPMIVYTCNRLPAVDWSIYEPITT